MTEAADAGALSLGTMRTREDGTGEYTMHPHHCVLREPPWLLVFRLFVLVQREMNDDTVYSYFVCITFKFEFRARYERSSAARSQSDERVYLTRLYLYCNLL